MKIIYCILLSVLVCLFAIGVIGIFFINKHTEIKDREQLGKMCTIYKEDLTPVEQQYFKKSLLIISLSSDNYINNLYSEFIRECLNKNEL